jgi:hypothetical protein
MYGSEFYIKIFFLMFVCNSHSLATELVDFYLGITMRGVSMFVKSGFCYLLWCYLEKAGMVS